MTVTREQATAVALDLFPDEFHDGSDCQSEVGRIGQPCRYCADLSRLWQARIDQVHKVLLDVLAK